jgi:hypothetical protein
VNEAQWHTVRVKEDNRCQVESDTFSIFYVCPYSNIRIERLRVIRVGQREVAICLLTSLPIYRSISPSTAPFLNRSGFGFGASVTVSALSLLARRDVATHIKSTATSNLHNCDCRATGQTSPLKREERATTTTSAISTTATTLQEPSTTTSPTSHSHPWRHTY